MRVSKKKKAFDQETLDSLIKNKHSCVILKECQRKVILEALYSNDIKTGIVNSLNKGLKQYDNAVSGFLLGFKKIKVLPDSNNCKIVGRNGEFQVTIGAQMYVFQPVQGNILEGTVNAISTNHIGCLVHKYFNARILKPEGMEYSKWQCRNIKIGDKILFEIIDVDVLGRLPYITGDMTSKCNKLQNLDESILSEMENSNIHMQQKNILHNGEKKKKKKDLASNASSSHENVNKNEAENKKLLDRKDQLKSEDESSRIEDSTEIPQCAEKSKSHPDKLEKKKRKNQKQAAAPPLESDKGTAMNIASPQKENQLPDFIQCTQITPSSDEVLKSDKNGNNNSEKKSTKRKRVSDGISHEKKLRLNSSNSMNTAPTLLDYWGAQRHSEQPETLTLKDTDKELKISPKNKISPKKQNKSDMSLPPSGKTLLDVSTSSVRKIEKSLFSDSSEDESRMNNNTNSSKIENNVVNVLKKNKPVTKNKSKKVKDVSIGKSVASNKKKENQEENVRANSTTSSATVSCNSKLESPKCYGTNGTGGLSVNQNDFEGMGRPLKMSTPKATCSKFSDHSDVPEKGEMLNVMTEAERASLVNDIIFNLKRSFTKSSKINDISKGSTSKQGTSNTSTKKSRKSKPKKETA